MQPGFFTVIRCALLGTAMLVGGCATTTQRLTYEVDSALATVWPQPPDAPRYRHLGTLTGEENLVRENEGWFGKFMRWVIGLGESDRPDPLVLQRPSSGVVDDGGRVLVTDVSRHSVVVFDIEHAVLDEWQYASSDTAFRTPVGISLGPENTYYVADADLKLVVKLDHNGKPIGSFGNDVLKRPTGIARDPVRQKIYVADTKEHNIKVFDDSGFLEDVLGSQGGKIGEFNAPTHIYFANGKLYVTDTFNTRIQVFDQHGDVTTNFGERGVYLGDLVRPKGVAADSEGNIYVIESLHDYLLVYDKSGQFLLPVGGTGAEVGQFYLPSGVWADKKDNIYVTDMFNGRVVILKYLGGGEKHGSVGTAAVDKPTLVPPPVPSRKSEP